MGVTPFVLEGYPENKQTNKQKKNQELIAGMWEFSIRANYVR